MKSMLPLLISTLAFGVSGLRANEGNDSFSWLNDSMFELPPEIPKLIENAKPVPIAQTEAVPIVIVKSEIAGTSNPPQAKLLEPWRLDAPVPVRLLEPWIVGQAIPIVPISNDQEISMTEAQLNTAISTIEHIENPTSTDILPLFR